MVVSPEILGRNWWEVQEFQKPTFEQKLEHFWLERDDYAPEEFSALKERFESHLSLYERPAELNMRLLEERVDATLDTAEKRKIAFDTWLTRVEDEAKLEDIKTPTNIEEVQQVAGEKMIQKITEKIPFLWAIVWFMWAWFWASVFKWFSDFKKEGWVFWWILGKFFGIEKELQEWENQIANFTNNTDVVINTIKDQVEPISTPNIMSESIVENIDTSKYQYLIWYKLLLGLSGVSLENNSSKDTIWNQLFEVKYSDFLEQRNEVGFRNKMTEGNSASLKQYEKISEALTSEKVHTLLRIWLSWNMVASILVNNETNIPNENFIENFWESRLNEILQMIENWEYNYAKLSIGEIWMLYSATIPAISNRTISSAAAGFWKWVQEIMWVSNDFIKENQEKSFFSESFIKKMGRDLDQWREKFNFKEDKLIEEFWLTGEQEIEDLRKLNNFKDYILSDEFIGNNKLMLSEEHRGLLESKLNYKWMIALYGVMWGNKLEEISPVNTPIIVWLLNKIMSTGNKPGDNMTAANYLAGFWKEILIPWETSVFTEDEKAVFDIYKEKILDMTILSYMKEINGIIGLAVNKEDLLSTWVAVWATWLWLRYLWKKSTGASIKAWRYPFLWKIATKAGWAGIIWWTLMGWLAIISENSDIGAFDRDLEAAYDAKDIEKVIEILEKGKDSIKSYEKWDQEAKIVAYEWWSPYVIYNEEIYSIEVLPTENSIKDANAFNYWKWILLNMIWVSKDGTIDWENITNIKSQENDIIFWKSWESLSIDDLMMSNWEDRIVDTRFVEKINAMVKSIDPDYKFLDGARWKSIYTIWSLSWWEFLIGLVPMDIELKTIEAKTEA